MSNGIVNENADTDAGVGAEAEADQSQEAVGSIRVFHLITNVTLIAKIGAIDYQKGIYLLLRPTELKAVPTKTGIQPELIPYLSVFGMLPPLEQFELDATDVVMVRDETPQVLEQAYREFTNDIAVPAKPQLIVP